MSNQPETTVVKNVNISKFQNDLIRWFLTEKRHLPWRENKDPYQVWVSEIMLQQTKVDTVIPYFERFITKFPTLHDLARADEQEVLKAWEGLGYYSRARNLQNAVREVVASYGGEVPDHPEQLGALKGVGPYTKGAILSIAFDAPEPAVDGNVMRVLSRILLIEDNIALPRTRKLVEGAVRELISEQDPSSFNQGLMELGALICTPKSPSCLLCPVQEHCQAFALGRQTELPVKAKSKRQPVRKYLSFLLEDEQGNVLIEQRPENGLLASLWQFPMAATEQVDPPLAAEWIKQQYGIEVELTGQIDQIRHVFSHVIWEIDVWKGQIKADNVKREGAGLTEKNRLPEYPFPVSHQKILKHLNL